MNAKFVQNIVINLLASALFDSEVMVTDQTTATHLRFSGLMTTLATHHHSTWFIVVHPDVAKLLAALGADIITAGVKK